VRPQKTAARIVSDDIVSETKSLDFGWLNEAMLADVEIDELRLASIVGGLQRLMSNRAFSVIGTVFRSLELVDLSPKVIVALLRVTFPMRAEVPEWRLFLRSKAKPALRAKGLEPDVVLRGLE
jgi:hypothetical protein